MRDTVNRKDRIVASREDQAKIIDLIRQHCHAGLDGCAHYDHPWNDTAIANAIGHDLNDQHVAKWRTALCGPLVKSVAVAALETGLKARLHTLDAELAAIWRDIDALTAWATRQQTDWREGL